MMVPEFDLVIMVDWSAKSKPGPAAESPDQCWIAAATRDEPAGSRPPPRYFRTRNDCMQAIFDLLSAHIGSAFVGFDFAFGYPTAEDGSRVLPTGRNLCALLAGLIEDNADNSNNRFDVADELNRRIRTQTGKPRGPFWGTVGKRTRTDLTPTQPRDTGVHEFRTVELDLRSRRQMVQSPWKLAYPASVGSQSLMGLPAVHHLLTHAELAHRTALWPFDRADDTATDRIVLAEIWPSISHSARVDHPIKDARQVTAMRDAFMDNPAIRGTLNVNAPLDGWIVGVQKPDLGT